ncbi:NHLP family bacteriocin export ABC transporter peptidase/permease/ATPase subunit [Lignipirellula cremea]|uniref:Lactococcin-G-processing and transport ATP-binding protein LagD n=1 Tax=Lignipirellula cremea TaxID=2528010 RepID=A0A518DQM8_9BACT|nr:NHLP family bacteriocin export ABC transporter peptidase/permease/ATPase subunit [Lignipirellula cremea]QDU94145.1 Lactococcin-G-processing and transport ATP-binding protein LagD [Lignipirellula cremea]
MSEKTQTPASVARVKTPTVLQMEAVECGAAALAMVLAYYGRIVPLEEIRVACGVSRDGTKASNILKAARQYNLKAKGFSKQLDSLGSMSVPMIVFWNFNHFVVFEGFHGGKAYLNDPAMGPRVISQEEFAEGFTGVVLVFEPGPDFKKGGKRPSFFAAMRERMVGSEWGLLYVILCTLAISLIGLVAPLFAKVFIDYVLIRNMVDWVAPLLAVMAVTGLVQSGVVWLQRYYLLRLSTKMGMVASYRYLGHVLRLPMEFFTQRYGGEIGSRISINDRLAQMLAGDLSLNVLNILMAGLYLGLMLYFNIGLTLIVVLFAGLNVAALQLVSRRRIDISMRLLQERGKMMTTSMSGLQSIETLKATGGESDFFSRWAGHLAKVMGARQDMEVLSQGFGALPGLLTMLSSVLILGLGALLVMQDALTIGALVAFQALMYGFMGPVNSLVMLGASVQDASADLNRLDDVMRYKIDPNLEVRNTLGDDESPKLSGHLELRKITFGYSPLDPPLIRDFRLSIAPGRRVALVGSSASGKSTLAKVISGLVQPWSGEILLDGVPRQDKPRQVITNSISMVDQEFFLYEGTLREVLTMWDKTIPEEDIIQAAKDACIHADIASRAGGYDSMVEEGGRNFSHGQRQRLEIARALVGKPSILVLDEATSALDTVTEKQIDEHLRRRGCTCIIVAHRLSTIRDSDEIIVLSQGKVVQRGTHEQLYAKRGLYRTLITTED